MSALWLAILCLPLRNGLASADSLFVEGRSWRISIDRQSSSLRSLKDRSGYNYVIGDGASLLRLKVAETDGTQRQVSASAAAESTVRAAQTGGIVIDYSDIGYKGLSARIRIRPRGDALLFKADVTNNAGIIVNEVIFPDLALKPIMGPDGADDRILAPSGDGVLMTREHIDALGWSPMRHYPGHCSMQFVAMYDDDSGLSITCRDETGQCKLIGYEKAQDRLNLRLSILRPHVPNLSYRGPWYSVQRCNGSWQSAAANYRTWARKQWWAMRAQCNDDRPAWLKKMPLLLDIGLRPLGNGKMFVPHDQIRALADEWRKELKAQAIVGMLRSWEKDGIYVMPDCLPVYPGPEGFSRITGQLHESGHHAACMVAGLKWMIEREGFHTPHYNVGAYDGRQLFDSNGRAVCVVDKAGDVIIDEPYFTWDGTKAYICPATEYAQDFYPRLGRRLAELGVDLFEFDQMNGGGTHAACYGDDHGHPPRYGPWVAASIRDMFSATKRAGTQVNPDFAITMEDVGELYIDLVDTFCGRHARMAQWPAQGKGSSVVPAFSFVYHDLKPAIELDVNQSCLQPKGDMAEKMRLEGLTKTARSFVWGRMLSSSLRAWEIMHRYGTDDLFPIPQKMEADQLRLLKHASAIFWGPAFPFVSRGTLIDAGPPEDVPKHPIHQKRGDTEFIHSEPMVHRSVFGLADGRRACLLVSTAPRMLSCTVPKSVLASSDILKVYRNDRPPKAIQVSAATQIPLAPYDVVAILAPPQQ